MFGFRKVWRKIWEKKMWKKRKSKEKKIIINKLFLYKTSNFFHEFNISIYRLNHLKIYKFLNNCNYI